MNYLNILISLLLFLLIIFLFFFVIDIVNFNIFKFKQSKIVSKFPILLFQNSGFTPKINDFFQNQLKKISLDKIFTGKTTNQINFPNLPPITFSSQFKLPQYKHISYNSKYVSIVNDKSSWDNLFLSVGENSIEPLTININLLNKTFEFTNIFIRDLKINALNFSNLRLLLPPSDIIKNNEILIQYDIHLKYNFNIYFNNYSSLQVHYDTYGLLNLAIIHENLFYKPYNIPSLIEITNFTEIAAYPVVNNTISILINKDNKESVKISDDKSLTGNFLKIFFNVPVYIKNITFITENNSINNFSYELFNYDNNCIYPKIITNSFIFVEQLGILITNATNNITQIKLDTLQETENEKYTIGVSTLQIVPNNKSTHNITFKNLNFEKPLVKFFQYKIKNIIKEYLDNLDLIEILNSICYNCPSDFKTDINTQTLKKKINTELKNITRNIINSLNTNLLTQPINIYKNFTYTIKPLQIDLGKLLKSDKSLPIYIINKKSTLSESIFSSDIDGNIVFGSLNLTDYITIKDVSSVTISNMKIGIKNFSLNMELDNFDLESQHLKCSLNFTFEFSSKLVLNPTTTFANIKVIDSVTIDPFYFKIKCQNLPFELILNNHTTINDLIFDVLFYTCNNFSEISFEKSNRNDDIDIDWNTIYDFIGKYDKARNEIFDNIDPILQNIQDSILNKIKNLNNNIIYSKKINS